MPADNNLLFVYGTLLSGFTANRYLGGSRKLGEAVARGYLMDVGHPAMVDIGTGQIHGEVWEVPNEETWRAIDIYEGVASRLFIRRRTQVEMRDGSGFFPAWHYEYLPKPLPKDHILVSSGDWRLYCRKELARRA